ncbi:hypothetical protein SAMN04515656_104144 [Eubacterium aggregans]|uniref:Uncharacterized protein n=1 Tax=Eubacterium aggregans TaxID=81409 RepID=A0A1H3YXU3_9FIRM|nr:hypothetical protein [Eubacterium aggregans]SEA15892.1 hypothetical protein SAMN04515656_104144 [Eubacterium aggregans]
MIDVAKAFSVMMEILDVPCEYQTWTQVVSYPYWVYEILGSPVVSEDGMEELTIILTGFSKGKALPLAQAEGRIKQYFKHGVTVTDDDGSTICFSYGGFQSVSTGAPDLKRIDITISVKKWSV